MNISIPIPLSGSKYFCNLLENERKIKGVEERKHFTEIFLKDQQKQNSRG